MADIDDATTPRWTRVYNELKRRIQTLELAPGAHLSESGIARQFEVSASPVRDALGRLTSEGLLTVEQRKGYTVTPLAVPDITGTCDLRFVLESGVVRLAIDRASDEQIQELRKLAQQTGDNDLAKSDQILANCRFHVEIARLSQSKQLVEAVRKVMEGSVRIFHLGIASFSPEDMRGEHEDLLDALKDRDEERALAICHREAYGTAQRVLDALLRPTNQSWESFVSLKD